MRYLNKIVFINSAHIKYEEVRLDGNVHFIGTQGVGKSTLLRAILFFYNADKSKLGIQTGQRSFDDFYLPKQDSYIIYEVKRENGCFFIVAFRSQGRTAYRFVDSEYRREYFLDEGGNVFHEWGKISERIGSHFKSHIVRHYATYLDILYGNRQKVELQLRRFSIMESQKYLNIPHTIQNIFLNQGLESRAIKDTIINSLDFADGDVELNVWRSEVKDFRQQYEDIWKWYRKEKNGHVKVRDDADAVVSRYTLYKSKCDQTVTLGGELQYALQRDKESMPGLQRQLNGNEQELQRQKRLLKEEEKKHGDEHDKLVREDGVLKQRLDETKSKRQYYETIGIADIIRRMKEEPALNVRLQSLTKQMDLLTAKSADVKQRYESMIAVEDLNLQQSKLQAEREGNECKAARQTEEANLRQQYSEKRDNVQESYLQRQAAWQEKHETFIQEKAELKNRALTIRTQNPFHDAMDEAKRRIGEQTQQRSEKESRLKDIDRNIQRITHEAEMIRKNLEHEADLKVKELSRDAEDIRKEIQSLDELLQRQKGSLIEWLSTHIKGWENNIGKVLDEEQVLYNDSLNPSLNEKANDSVYGVHINTDNINRHVRTPQDIQREKEEKENAVDKKMEEISQLRSQLEQDIAQQQRKPTEQLKQLRKEKLDTEVLIRSLTQGIKVRQDELKQKEEELQEWRTKELTAVQAELTNVEEALEQLKQEHERINTQHANDLTKLDKDFARQKKENDQQAKLRLQAIADTLRQKEQDIQSRKKTLLAQMDAELRGDGIDTEQLGRMRAERQEVEAELAFIENHRKDYFAWQKDDEELFSHEQETRDQRKAIQQKLHDLDNKYAERRQKYQSTITQLTQENSRLKTEIEQREAAIKEAEQFIGTSDFLQNVGATSPVETVKPLGELLASLRQNIYHKQEYLAKFQESVSTFKKNFSAQNTFGFPTEFNTEAEYVKFASELNEFVANNSIESYRVQVSDAYSYILQRISRKVSDLLNHKGVIEGTIADINRDFNNNNFAGVIKDIELRTVPSNDRLMQHLFNIQKYTTEHADDLGAMNLFTSEESRKDANEQAVKLLMTLVDMLDAESKRDYVTLADTFKLEFKVQENDNDTGWVEKLSNVGSDGTDVLVKAMVNIMLINVFKRKLSRKFGDFNLHCMMDEIGKLHPNNVKGILDFANARNIYLINSSPTTYTATQYRYTYLLTKDSQSNTRVESLLALR